MTIQTGEFMGYGIENSLAIEMDTYQNPDNGDPNSNHIGLDYNGTVKSAFTPLLQLNWIAGCRGVWVSYAASGQTLSVWVSNSSAQPAVTTFSSKVDCMLVSLGALVYTTNDNA